MTHFHSRKVKKRHLIEGELVLRKIEAVGKGSIYRKLALKYEGLYITSKEETKNVLSPSTLRRCDT